MSVGAASGRESERTEVDNPTAAKGTSTLPVSSAWIHEAAGSGNPMPGSDVVRSANRAGLDAPGVMTVVNLMVESHRAGRRAGRKREHGRGGKKLLSHQNLLRGCGTWLDHWR